MGDVPGYIREPAFSSGQLVDVLLHDHYPAPHRFQITGWPEWDQERGRWEYVGDAIAQEHRGMLGVRFTEDQMTTAECGLCNEEFQEGQARAELGRAGDDNMVVHAEPCAATLQAAGWEIA